MAVATNNSPPTTAVERINPERWAEPVRNNDELRRFLQSAKGSIQAALPKHLTPERMIRVCMTAAIRQPKLLECTAVSFIAAAIQSSQLGLECDGVLGQAYMIPFKKNTKLANGKWDSKMEVQLIPGYKGLVKLARNSGELVTIQDRAVYKGDDFRFSFGLDPVLEHTPRYLASGNDDITHAWAAAVLRGGGKQFEVMSIQEIEKIRARSKAADSGPWVTDFEMMCRKTVIRRLCRLLPLSVELQTALDLESRHDAGKSQHFTSAIELLPQELQQIAGPPAPDDDAVDAIDAEPVGPQESLAPLTDEERNAQRQRMLKD